MARSAWQRPKATGGPEREAALAGARDRAPTGSELEDRILALLASGDTRAAATLAIRGFGPGTLRYLRALLGGEADALDAFSSFSERLWRGLPGFRAEASLRTWVFRLAWSVASDLRKEAWRARGRRLDTGEAAAIPADDGTRSWLRAERLRLSLQALRRVLSLEDQSLLQLRIDQGLSWAECAAVLAVEERAPTAEALMKRFERIKERLARLAREQDRA